MTTIIATSNKILSDGKTTFGDRVDSLNTCKVRKIGDYLVGGAGRHSSILTFFAWFESYVQCQLAQEALPGLVIDSNPDNEDEDFIALVVHPDGKIYMHEGNSPTKAFVIESPYYAVGSGSDYALAALDAGATPEQAMEVAKMRDVFSGGETFVEERANIVDLTEEDLEGLSREQLISIIVTGECDLEEEHEQGACGGKGLQGQAGPDDSGLVSFRE